MEIIKGNTFQFKFNFTINGQEVPVGTSDELIFTVKKSYSDPDSKIIITKTKADMAYDNGYIVTINPNDTKDIALGTNEYIDLNYDIKFKGTFQTVAIEKTLKQDTIRLRYSITR